MVHDATFDIVGIGFGPANIALAIALEELGSGQSTCFLERRAQPGWHPDMLLEGADIQNNPLRDFVTPRNPRSHYTFINYLHQEGRLFDYLNLGLEFPLRKDYARYVQWVAHHFDPIVHYGADVTSIEQIGSRGEAPSAYRVTTRGGPSYLGRALVIGPGRTPLIPPVFQPLLGDRVFHFTEYLAHVRNSFKAAPQCTICVVGGSQSAVEIVLDLSKRLPHCRIVNVMRNYGYRLKDTSPFSEHVYFPEFTDYFYNASEASKSDLWNQLKYTNYSAADGDVIRDLYLRLYEQKLEGRSDLQLMCSRVIDTASIKEGCIEVRLREIHTGAVEALKFDLVVLATGFRNFGSGEGCELYPRLLESLIDHLMLTKDSRLHIGREYQLEARNGNANVPPIYLNGLCESSHGFGDAGSFSLLSIRSATIARSLLRRLNGRSALPPPEAAYSHRRGAAVHPCDF
jgi:L-ornithine N5-oxygenase